MIYSKNRKPRTIEAVHTHTHTHTGNLKNSRGITLIALVITIIVLLVLAGATFAMISGENGILKKVVHAKESTEKASVEEKIRLAIQSALSSDYNEHGKITKETLIQEFENNELIESGNDLEEIGNKWILATNDEKYIIYSDGKFEIEQNKLPPEYQELEYIEGTGTQFIDTGVRNNNNIGCEIKFAYTNTSGTQYIIGEFTSSKSRFNPLAIDEVWTEDGFKNNFFYVNSIKFSPIVYTTKDTNIHTVKFNCDGNRDILFDDIYKGKVGTIATDEGENIYLFARNHKGVSFQSKVKIYICKIFNNSSLIRNLIPCNTKGTIKDVEGNNCDIGTIGMYDMVNDQFYTNKGSGNFIPGPEIE